MARTFEAGGRRYVALAPELFASTAAKTAHGVIAYSSDETVAVIDPDLAGKSVRDVLPYLERDIPVVSNVAEALRFRPTSLLVGVAPPGGKLPVAWRSEILRAIDAGLEIVSGLHELLEEDPEISKRATAAGVRLWDVRVPPKVELFSGAAFALESRIVLTVGSDCASGKMTASLELTRAAMAGGTRAIFVPTGQTGIMIAGWGIAVDRVIADFISGAAEALVVEGARRRGELLFVEGQGSINHPAFAGVTLGLLYGSAPDALILVHEAGRRTINGFDQIPLLSLHELIGLYEELCAAVKPAKVAGIALNTRKLAEADARRAIEAARSETGLPVDDVVRFGPQALYAGVAPKVRKTAVKSSVR
jgi:uncharacterized NAD-dependent epimerase/dehydratase family protein